MRDKYSFVPDPATPVTHQPARDQIDTLFGTNKTARKHASNTAQATLNARLLVVRKPKAVHTALHTYERAHLRGGGNWLVFRQQLLAHFAGSLRLADGLPHFSECFVTVTGVEHKVGTIYFGEDRFEMIARPMLVQNDVYKRHGDTNATPRHYIRLSTTATHVKRFVTRGLSAFDGMNLTGGRHLQSVLNNDNSQATEIGGKMHGVGAGVLLSENQQILSHTRAWAGNKRYISTGVSNRPAISTRGTQFVSMYGAATIDLAMVPLATIFDVHRHDTAAIWLAVAAASILINNHHTGTGDVAEQRYLGLRDTIRTRELLIKSTVPIAAVRSTSLGRVLLGLGSPTNALHDSVEALIATLGAPILGTIQQQDHMDFRDPASNKRWHFLEFATPLALNNAHAALLPNLAGRTMVAFNKYTPVRPAGML